MADSRDNRYLAGTYVIGALPRNAIVSRLPPSATSPSRSAGGIVRSLLPPKSPAKTTPSVVNKVQPAAQASPVAKAAVAKAQADVGAAAQKMSASTQRLRASAGKNRKLAGKLNSIADALDAKAKKAQQQAARSAM